MNLWRGMGVGDKMAILGPAISILLWWFYVGRKKYSIPKAVKK